MPIIHHLAAICAHSPAKASKARKYGLSPLAVRFDINLNSTMGEG
jgi:hypothetical protein